ncbi:MAG TPA: HD domain-containing protein, partial [Bacteroidetes bacterium]|nr:HD domain-containing protein [Bacteroidota bacterium]
LAGLLHDLDYAETVDDFERHGFRTAEILSEEDLPEEILNAIRSHPGHLPRETLIEKALYAVDPLTGLIVAAALMHPEKKLAALDVDFVLRRFKEKRFAAGADRDQIRSSSEFGLELEEFLDLGLKGMCQVADELGL